MRPSIIHAHAVLSTPVRPSIIHAHAVLSTPVRPSIIHVHAVLSTPVHYSCARHAYMNRFTRGATCSPSRRLSKRHRSESSSSDGFVTRSKHKISYDASWKTDYQWYIPVYDSSASTIVGLLFSVCKQHGTKQRNNAGTWTDKPYTLFPPSPPYVKTLVRTLIHVTAVHTVIECLLQTYSLLVANVNTRPISIIK